MSELVSVVVTILAYTLVLVVKPEWLMGWLLNSMKKKMPLKNANDTTNALGIKAIEVGIYMIEGIADTNEKVSAKVKEMKDALEELRKELFPLS